MIAAIMVPPLMLLCSAETLCVTGRLVARMDALRSRATPKTKSIQRQLAGKGGILRVLSGLQAWIDGSQPRSAGLCFVPRGTASAVLADSAAVYVNAQMYCRIP